MTQFNNKSLAIGVAIALFAALLMVDGQIFGEMSTNFSRFLMVISIPVIAKSRKSGTQIETQRGQL
ncbi:MAG: hypothetical protein ACW98Y_02455 [Candidatus Thorarchaeota archaeon]|jgi:hypothetical protein